MNVGIKLSAVVTLMAATGCGSGPASGNASANEPAAAQSSNGLATSNQPASAKTGAVAPSFDCAKADSTIQEMICADGQLARLDNELTRLFQLSEKGPRTSSARVQELREIQRGWIKGRDDCWKAADKRQCAIESYAGRIAELRAGYADARTDDGKGISTGPKSLACDGLKYGIGVTFINADPALAQLGWLQSSVTLTQTEAASGARYSGDYYDGKYVLWIKGDEATFTMPGTGDVRCRLEEIG